MTEPNSGMSSPRTTRHQQFGLLLDGASLVCQPMDSAYRSKTNEEWLEKNGLTSDIHQRKPKGKPMPEAMSRANGRRSKVRSAVEHVFARQKDTMKLFVRTIGIGRAKVKIGMANIAYNMLRYVWHQGRTASA